MVGDDQLTLLQEFVCHAYAFAQKSTGILAQIEDETLHVSELLQRISYLALRCFLEPSDVDVADTWLDLEGEVNAVARNLVAHQAELHGLVDAFTQDRDMNSRALGSFEQVGDIRGAHVVGSPAIDGYDHVAGMDPSLVCGRADKRENDDDLVVARTDRHAHAVVLAALLFTQQRIGFRIEEIRVRIERVQHARNCAVIDGFVRIYGLGVVVLNHLINLGELLKAILYVRVAGGRNVGAFVRKQHAQTTAGDKDDNYNEERTTRTTSHLLFP